MVSAKQALALLGVLGLGFFLWIEANGGFGKFKDGLEFFVAQNQNIFTLGLGLFSLFFIYLIFTREGQKVMQVKIPEPNAVSFDRAWASLEEAGDAQSDWTAACFNEYYGPPQVIPLDLNESGLYAAVFEANCEASELPRGLTRKEVLLFVAGLTPKPFIEKSRLLARVPYKELWVGHHAKKWGDIAYETLGAQNQRMFINKLLEDNPELLPLLNLNVETEKAVKTEGMAK